MSYDVNKLVKLGALKSLSEKIKSDYATKAELKAIKVAEYSITKLGTAESGYLATYQLTKDRPLLARRSIFPRTFWSIAPTFWRWRRQISPMMALRLAISISTLW